MTRIKKTLAVHNTLVDINITFMILTIFFCINIEVDDMIGAMAEHSTASSGGRKTPT